LLRPRRTIVEFRALLNSFLSGLPQQIVKMGSLSSYVKECSADIESCGSSFFSYSKGLGKRQSETPDALSLAACVSAKS
jgi:hypothetical protein